MTVSMCDRRLFGCSTGWLPDEWPWSPMRWQPQASGTGDTTWATWMLRLPNGVARVIGGTSIAGSTLTLDAAVAYGVQTVGLTPLEVIEAATVVPARILGVDDEFGRLEPGYVGDAVLFDKDWQVRSVWIGGQLVGEREQ